MKCGRREEGHNYSKADRLFGRVRGSDKRKLRKREGWGGGNESFYAFWNDGGQVEYFYLGYVLVNSV